MKACDIHDLTHEGLFEIFGDFLHETPEVVDAIRGFAYESRPAGDLDGCKVRMPTSSNATKFKLRFGQRLA
jgi:hypothetical protein